MVYLDSLRLQGMKYRGKSVRTCHMLADSKEELIAFAKKIGMKESWLHKDHFDLMEGKRKLAIEEGAVELDRRKFSEVFRRLKCVK